MDTSDYSNLEVMDDLAKVVLKRLDTPRSKSEDPIPPLVAEVCGTNKSGKNTLITELDRWFRRRKFNVRLQEESAEVPWIRATPKHDVYTHQMSHFAYEFTNLLQAISDRHAHLFLANRNIVDNLYWMESWLREGKVIQEEVDTFKSFIFLMSDPKVALEREYGNTQNVIYGAKMNPEKLELLYECTQNVIKELGTKYPNLPIIRIDTSSLSIPEVRDQAIAFLLRSASKRLLLTEDDVLPWSVALMRQKASLARLEIKMRRECSHATLRDCGWQFETAVAQRDTYLLPPDKEVKDKEYFRIRETGGRWCHYDYKRNDLDFNRRMRLNIPLAAERIGEFLSEFQIIAVIEKEREIFVKDGTLLHRDNVKDLGLFTEFYGSKDVQEADLIDVAGALGFDVTDMVRSSYLKLYLENAKKK